MRYTLIQLLEPQLKIPQEDHFVIKRCKQHRFFRLDLSPALQLRIILMSLHMLDKKKEAAATSELIMAQQLNM